MNSIFFPKSWGAEYVDDSQVRFRLWASGQNSVTLRLNGEEHEMDQGGDGWFEALLSDVAPGAEYQYMLAEGSVVPDPASRAQKGNVNGPSLVIDPTRYAWQHLYWRGAARGKKRSFKKCMSVLSRRKGRFRPPARNCPISPNLVSP